MLRAQVVSNLSSKQGFDDDKIADVLSLKTEHIAGIRERLHGKDGKRKRSARARAKSMMIRQRAEPDTREHKLEVDEVLYMDVNFEPSLPVTVELLVDRVASLRSTKVRFQPSEAASFAMGQTSTIGCEDSIFLTGDACGRSDLIWLLHLRTEVRIPFGRSQTASELCKPHCRIVRGQICQQAGQRARHRGANQRRDAALVDTRRA